MNPQVHQLPFNNTFAAALAGLCAQQAVQGRRLVSSFVAPGTTTVILIFA
jgi:hypothetical protein